MNKNAFVTGSTGFIGYHLCKRLNDEGYRIIAVGREDENKIECGEFYSSYGEIIWEDIPSIDVCFHLGANNDTLEKDECLMNNENYHSSISLFERLLKKGCPQFVYSSSCSIYGKGKPPLKEENPPDPLNPYARSKLMFENFANHFAKSNRVNCVGLRYSNVYGTHEGHKGRRASMIYQLIQNFRKDERPKLFKYGEQKRDWVYVRDVVDANLLASTYQESDIFNIGSGDSVEFNQLIDIMQKNMKNKISPEYIDCPFEDAFQNDTTISLDKSKSKLKYSPAYRVDRGVNEILQTITIS